ncbi:hypothetical protein MKX03_027026, partial [Papaver bracteatum]
MLNSFLSVLHYWIAEHSYFIEKREGAQTVTPRFARWDTLKISKKVDGLGKFPYANAQ